MTDQPHTCHARGCARHVPRHLFMCRQHWFALPMPMREAVWDAYIPGQEHDWSLVTRAYLDATRVAIDWTWNQEQPAHDEQLTLGDVG